MRLPKPSPQIQDVAASAAGPRDCTPGADDAAPVPTDAPAGGAAALGTAPGMDSASPVPASIVGMVPEPGLEDADAPPAPKVPGWAIGTAILACAGVLFLLYQAFADNRCALRLGPTGYPHGYRLGLGCLLQVEGLWASETDWVQAPDGEWRQPADLRRPKAE
jgi:hypothetical protein